jgi:hypothetical protein
LHGALDEKRVVVRGDLSTGEARRGIETNTVSTGGTVNLDLARVGGKALRRVFGGDTALDGVTALGDGLLREAELGKSSARSDLDLSGDDVDCRREERSTTRGKSGRESLRRTASDLLGNGVLDLNTRVDFDEVVTFRVDKELASSSVAVPDGLRDLASVGEEALAHLLAEVGSRTLLNDLLVTTLDGAVALEEVDDISGRVAEKLSLCTTFDESGGRKRSRARGKTDRCAWACRGNARRRRFRYRKQPEPPTSHS